MNEGKIIKCAVCGDNFTDADIENIIFLVNNDSFFNEYICDWCLDNMKYYKCKICGKYANITQLKRIRTDYGEFIVHKKHNIIDNQ